MYVQSNTLLLPDVFENFINVCLRIYKLDHANYFSAPELAWQAAFKKTKVKFILIVINGRKILALVGKKGKY